MGELVQRSPNPATSEPPQGHVKHTGFRGEGLLVILPNWQTTARIQTF